MTAVSSQVKPSKPYPDYPLTAHSSGQWCKVIRKRRHYFGPWRDWRGALERFNEVKDRLYAGQSIDDIGGEKMTVADLLCKFHRRKVQPVADGQFTERSLLEYQTVSDQMVDTLGKSREVETLTEVDFTEPRSRLGKGECGKRISPSSGLRQQPKQSFSVFCAIA